MSAAAFCSNPGQTRGAYILHFGGDKRAPNYVDSFDFEWVMPKLEMAN
ncbi:MAG: hypothetical protein ACI8X5_001160 [Planctomycetota bacterium]|jgi:hypothetical protein